MNTDGKLQGKAAVITGGAFCASRNSMGGRLMYRLKAFVETGKPDPQWTE